MNIRFRNAIRGNFNKSSNNRESNGKNNVTGDKTNRCRGAEQTSFANASSILDSMSMISSYNAAIFQKNGLLDKNTNKPETPQTTAAEQTKPADAQQEANSYAYEDSITLTSGKKTEYRREYNGKMYYYESLLDLAQASLLVDPSSTAVGSADVEQRWGERTDYSIEYQGSYFYFTRDDYNRNKAKTIEEQVKLAVGRAPVENKGSADIESNADAVTELQGEKTEFYIDIKGQRYYYSSLAEMANAQSLVEPASTACGKAATMTEWGIQSDYYIDYKGSRCYFATESDKQKAQLILNHSGDAISWLKINELLVGKGSV